ncbi:hypothetical protein PR048_024992 [Dryococelus australis]|uniref:Uncharacterized protein n=1 Tax=Dryococelus australis TaxID=614101 RepID=A0ABQ9GQ35_9NEOP|nr:hypothetical protein PR048_024992 [Dryococelus australis]
MSRFVMRPMAHLTRATVAERLACSPPTKANWAQSPVGSLPDFRLWESCQTMPLVSGFSRGSPVYPALSFRRCSMFVSITPVGSQDIVVKSPPPPNLFTRSLTHAYADPVTRNAMERHVQLHLEGFISMWVLRLTDRPPYKALPCIIQEAIIDGRTYPSPCTSLGDDPMRKGAAPTVTLAYIGALFDKLGANYRPGKGDFCNTLRTGDYCNPARLLVQCVKV